MKTRGLLVASAALCGLAITVASAAASTGIRLTAKDGSIICARTMEAGTDLQSNLLIVPRNYAFTGTGQENTKGMHWTTKYGFVGPNAQGQSWVCDGLNEKGLAVGSFLFPNRAGHTTTEKHNANHTLAANQVATYLLGTCGNVQDAVNALRNIYVWTNTTPQSTNETWTYTVCDAQGHRAIIRLSDGQIDVNENTQGVVTNSPAFHWNLGGLRNYIQNAVPTRNAQQCVWQAFHLLNQFDVPVGLFQSDSGDKWAGSFTNWTTAADLTHLCYYFHTYQNRQINMIDLNKVNLNAKTIKTVSMQRDETVNDLSGNIN